MTDPTETPGPDEFRSETSSEATDSATAELVATIDLDHLRSVAEGAQEHKPGKWRAGGHEDGHSLLAMEVWNDRNLVVSVGRISGDGEEEAIAEHIATFDPPTVLSLIAELRQLREQVEKDKRKWEAHKALVRNERDENKRFDRIRTLQEENEALREQVAAVRAIHEDDGTDTCDDCFDPWPCRTIKALGGNE